MTETERVNLIEYELADLFELRRGSLGTRNCPQFAYTYRAKTGDYKLTAVPTDDRNRPASIGYKKMVRGLGIQARFSVAVSPRRFPTTAWLSREWDWEIFEGITPDEDFLENAPIDRTLLAFISEVLTPHWKFTGNRSVHIDFFLKTRISLALGARFLDAIRPLVLWRERRNKPGQLHAATSFAASGYGPALLLHQVPE